MFIIYSRCFKFWLCRLAEVKAFLTPCAYKGVTPRRHHLLPRVSFPIGRYLCAVTFSALYTLPRLIGCCAFDNLRLCACILTAFIFFRPELRCLGRMLRFLQCYFDLFQIQRYFEYDCRQILCKWVSLV